MGREGNPKFNVAKGRASHVLEHVAGVHISARRRSLFSPARTCNEVENERVHDEREREGEREVGSILTQALWWNLTGTVVVVVVDDVETTTKFKPYFGVYSTDIFVWSAAWNTIQPFRPILRCAFQRIIPIISFNGWWKPPWRTNDSITFVNCEDCNVY